MRINARMTCLGCLFALSTGLAANNAEPLLWGGCGITKKAFVGELAAAFERKFGIEIVLEGGGATKGLRRISDL